MPITFAWRINMLRYDQLHARLPGGTIVYRLPSSSRDGKEFSPYSGPADGAFTGPGWNE